jgi:hypothetical protein
MVHRWLREARQHQAFTLTASQGEPAPDGHPNSPTYGHVKLPHLS